MKVFKNVLAVIVLFIFALLCLPMAALFIFLKLTTAGLEAMATVTDIVTDSIDDIMTSVCDALDNWVV